MDETRLAEFVAFARGLKGDEKSEAQTFLTRLFQAFGHAGAVEAGATFEHRIRIENSTKFSDLLWPGRVLIEMKSRGVNLDRVVPQAKAYWDNAYRDRTEYVVLCNFDEFVVYNWNLQREPLDTVELEQLPEMWRSLAFLAPGKVEPIFGNNLVALTKEAADRVADLYGHLVDRGIAPAAGGALCGGPVRRRQDLREVGGDRSGGDGARTARDSGMVGRVEGAATAEGNRAGCDRSSSVILPDIAVRPVEEVLVLMELVP